MRHVALSLKGLATVCIVVGALAGTFSLKSVGRASWEDAAGMAGGIVLAVGLGLLSLSLISDAMRRRREAAAAGQEIDVTPPPRGAA